MNKRVLLISFFLFSYCSVFAVKPTVLSVDFDDVISKRQKVGFTQYASLIPRIVFWHPSLLYHVVRWWNTLEKDGREIAQSVNGSSNVVHAMIQKLTQQGFPDISYYEPEIIARSTNPQPIFGMIDLLKQLKKQGYMLIGATNQDYIQDKTYRQKMKERGADLDELFDAILVTRVNFLNTINGKKIDDYKLYTEVENGVYMANSPNAYKPHSLYYGVLKQLAKELNPQANLIIHVDDKKENIEAADRVDGMQGILFDLPAGSARKSTPQEIELAIQGYKRGLEKYGISLGG